MSVSLHAAVVQTYLQILPSVAGLVAKAEAHCKENGLADETLAGACLAEDMWPFAKQIFECGHHSARAIEGVLAGEFSPERDPAPLDFASMREEVAATIATVEAVAPDELDAIAGRDMKFVAGDRSMPFTVADFLLSFSLPNFFFHSVTAYNILRNQGLAVGKMDFLGRLRLNK